LAEKKIIDGDKRIELTTKTRAWARGQKILNPPPELVLYINCKNWNCLPDKGGWYDQNPYVCDIFSFIDDIVSQEESKRAKKSMSKSKQ